MKTDFAQAQEYSMGRENIMLKQLLFSACISLACFALPATVFSASIQHDPKVSTSLRQIEQDRDRLLSHTRQLIGSVKKEMRLEAIRNSNRLKQKIYELESSYSEQLFSEIQSQAKWVAMVFGSDVNLMDEYYRRAALIIVRAQPTQTLREYYGLTSSKKRQEDVEAFRSGLRDNISVAYLRYLIKESPAEALAGFRKYTDALNTSQAANVPNLKAVPDPSIQKDGMQAVQSNKIDADSILNLAGSWQDYHKNKSDLSLLERKVAVRLLRAKDAWTANDTDTQDREIKALIAQTKKLPPVSKNELLKQVKMNQKYREDQVIAQNRAEDWYYNFAGDHTETVLDNAGLVIDLTKAGVILTGCFVATPACPGMIGVAAASGPAGTVAEGVGAGTAEYFYNSGKVSAALFEGTKASLIDFSTGKVGDAVAGAVAHKIASNMAKSVVKESVSSDPIKRQIQNSIYVGVMELADEGHNQIISTISKDVVKRTEASAEKMLLSSVAAQKTITPRKAKGDKKAAVLQIKSLKPL